jgi:RNA polymerase sigma-70 factor (ECF subfamily)
MSQRDAAGSQDADLLARVGEGDMAALRRLYEAHAPWLTVRLQRRCNDPGLVAEVVQDTFVAVWRGAGRYRGDGDPAAWLWGIAIRRLVSALRRSGSPASVVAWEWGPADDRHVPAALRGPSAEEQVLLGVEHGDLGAALRSLSPEMRAVVQATVLDGLTTKEAAHLLGLKENTVKTRLHRARRHLRTALAEGAT